MYNDFMDKKTSIFEFGQKFKYSIKQLIEFENSEPVRDQKCRTSMILIGGFVLYSIGATILSSGTNAHGRITNISIALFFSLIMLLVRITRNHTCTCIMGAFGLSTILFFHLIMEVNWDIGMDAFWLFILIMPFITNYIAGVIYGSISALSGLVLSILLLETPLNNYLQPYGSNMVNWYSVIYIVVMLAAATMEYELTSYQIEKMVSDQKISYLQKERTQRLREQIAIYESNELTIRKYKHDIRHFNRVLAGFIADEEYDKAANYLKEFDSMLEDVTAVSFCDNKIVNELLTIYASRCQKNGFRLRAKADVPERFPMQGIELTSLVANALENALEAQEKIPVDKRYIQFEMTYDGRKIKLMTKNPCTEDVVLLDNGLPQSTKAIQSGIGTQQIKNIAAKYGGAASFTAENGVFVLKAVMTCM